MPHDRTIPGQALDAGCKQPVALKLTHVGYMQ